MKILVAGGAGYIGTHTIVELYKAGHKVVCVDNLYNSKLSAVKNAEKIVGKKIPFYKLDCCDVKKLETLFKKEKKFDAVIMFQGYKAVGESVHKPLMYYENNIGSAISILKTATKYKCKDFIFSSSATVYGTSAKSPIKEEDPALLLNAITNPYGETKAVIEKILCDYSKAFDANVVLLRYFNPVGAHESGLIGEDPNGIPNNLMPYIAKVATGKLPYLNVYGDDYKTKDGTGVRDYIHVVDLAKGHVAALKCFKKSKNTKEGNRFIYNLGTGKGTSVLELVHAYEKACGKKIKYKIVGRRAGDIDKLYCDPSKAKRELGWKATLSIYDMCYSSFIFENNVKRSKTQM